MPAKLIIILFLVAIVWCLVSAFYYLVRDKGQGERTVWRLTWRVGLSLLLLVLLYPGFLMGWIEPGRGPIGLLPPTDGG
jgi:TRAP-type C4-dicarboxylate transport system permease large subunit